MPGHDASAAAPLVLEGPREGGGRRSMLAVYALLHLGALAAFWTGCDLFDIILGFFLLQFRGFCVSAGYHRYLAHKSFKTTRLGQFLLAAGACTALRGGPLWWVALHRHHHRFSDTDRDIFTPEKGFWWSYAGWLLSGRFDRTNYGLVGDLARYPELRWLNRWWLVPPLLLVVVVSLLAGWGGLTVGFCVSGVLTLHTMAALDGFNHLLGFQRYRTRDESRNSFVLSLVAMGEGWHNNHHHYPGSARLGFFWWEVDGTWTVLRLLGRLGLVWGLRAPTEAILGRRRLNESPAATEEAEPAVSSHPAWSDSEIESARDGNHLLDVGR